MNGAAGTLLAGLTGAGTVAFDPAGLLTGNLVLAVPVAFTAGLLSFLSPCVLPLVPGYLSYVTGLTGADLAGISGTAGSARPPRARPRFDEPNDEGGMSPAGRGGSTLATATRGMSWRTSRVVLGTVGFVLGFSLVFVSYGALFGGFGGLLISHQQLITQVLGVVVIIMGLSFMGLAIPGMSWLSADVRWHARPRRGVWGAPLLGLLFGLGWTPCVGPTLAVVQAMAFTEASALRGAALSMVYCMGLGIPLLLVGLAFEKGLGAIRWVRGHTETVMKVGGAMLLIIGVLLVGGLWGTLVAWMQVRTSGWVVPL